MVSGDSHISIHNPLVPRLQGQRMRWRTVYSHTLSAIVAWTSHIVLQTGEGMAPDQSLHLVCFVFLGGFCFSSQTVRPGLVVLDQLLLKSLLCGKPQLNGVIFSCRLPPPGMDLWSSGHFSWSFINAPSSSRTQAGFFHSVNGPSSSRSKRGPLVIIILWSV